MKQLNSTKKMVLIAIFAAIQIILACTPLGFIPVGVTRATTVHIPVILGGVLIGPGAGAILGAVFGLTSLVINTINPTITSFVFSPFYSVGEMNGNIWSLVIVMVPRILIGVTAHYSFRAVQKLDKSKILAYITAGLTGSLTNTLLVLGGIYIFFGESYAAVKEIGFDVLFKFIMGIIAVNGVPEAIVAALITVTIGKTLAPILVKDVK
ncbi:ECF transporter S component [Cellulosilyticum sp. I15G10I2]|uniref:ECF transporter S component n=1 Tax=Cellulosilyticum sp. I15G10I2 TaxID=1892843 RepID=UPI00085C5863|nr:ECF transporter S component [Cellulosilyticum sp. I15G10I2]